MLVRIWRIIFALLVALPAHAATYYVCAATGSPCNASDSNAGTSKTATWLHAPGMPNCASNCASYSPAPGDSIIFRGGDTWHFGNSGLSPYTGGIWEWAWSGSSGNNIYVGVDMTWYSGSSWTRPVMTADNPTSTSTTLGACTYQVGSPTSNDMLTLGGSAYTTIDNFEWMGFCTNGTTSETFGSDAMLEAGASTNVLVEHNYWHGWTHRAFSYPTYQYACMAILGGSTGDNYQFNVVDGSDSDPAGCGAFYDGLNIAAYNVFNAASQGIGNPCHVFHDNIMSNWVDPGDGNAHGNVFECVGEGSPVNVYYNNLFFNLYQAGTQGAIFWIGPSSGTTDYFFNNVIANTPNTGNYFNIQTRTTGGITYAFNSTLESDGSGPGLMDCEGGSNTTAQNMHFIGNTSPFYGGGTCNTVNNLAQSVATANADGYTNATNPLYAPQNGSSVTVGAGSSISSLCSAISAAAGSDSTLSDAAAQCPHSTQYGVSYNTSNHTVSSPGLAEISRPSPPSQGAFEAPTGASYNWTQTISPSGGGTITGTNSATGSYSSGTAIGPLTAAANTYYSLANPIWTSAFGGATCTGNTNPATSFSLSANAGCTANFVVSTALSITTSSPLPTGTVGVPYSYTMAAAGGVPPYTWSDPSCSGSCNTGLLFPNSGIWSGSPVNAGTSTFTIQVEDSIGETASGPFVLTINSAMTSSGSGATILILAAPPGGL